MSSWDDTTPLLVQAPPEERIAAPAQPIAQALASLSTFPILPDAPEPAPTAVNGKASTELAHRADLPEAMLFGEESPATADLVIGVLRRDGVERVTAPSPDDIRDTVPPGFYAGPGSRARLVMHDRAYLKSSTIVAASGRLAMTPAMSQLNGHATSTMFGDAHDPMCMLEGRAVLLLRVPRVAVALRGARDLYVMQSALMGFDHGFTWENGKVLGIDMVVLRGEGSLLLDTRGSPMLIPVEPDTPVHAARSAILAWSDGVRPSPVEGQEHDVRLFRLRGRGYVLVAFPPEASSGIPSPRAR